MHEIKYLVSFTRYLWSLIHSLYTPTPTTGVQFCLRFMVSSVLGVSFFCNFQRIMRHNFIAAAILTSLYSWPVSQSSCCLLPSSIINLSATVRRVFQVKCYVMHLFSCQTHDFTHSSQFTTRINLKKNSSI